MTLPLHHCRAIGCCELIDPGLRFCDLHLLLIPDSMVRLLCNLDAGADPEAEKTSYDFAVLRIAEIEGHVALPVTNSPKHRIQIL